MHSRKFPQGYSPVSLTLRSSVKGIYLKTWSRFQDIPCFSQLFFLLFFIILFILKIISAVVRQRNFRQALQYLWRLVRGGGGGYESKLVAMNRPRYICDLLLWPVARAAWETLRVVLTSQKFHGAERKGRHSVDHWTFWVNHPAYILTDKRFKFRSCQRTAPNKRIARCHFIKLSNKLFQVTRHRTDFISNVLWWNLIEESSVSFEYVPSDPESLRNTSEFGKCLSEDWYVGNNSSPSSKHRLVSRCKHHFLFSLLSGISRRDRFGLGPGVSSLCVKFSILDTLLARDCTLTNELHTLF